MNFYSYKDKQPVNLDLVRSINYKHDDLEIYFFFTFAQYDCIRYEDLKPEEFEEIKEQLDSITNTFIIDSTYPSLPLDDKNCCYTNLSKYLINKK